MTQIYWATSAGTLRRGEREGDLRRRGEREGDLRRRGEREGDLRRRGEREGDLRRRGERKRDLLDLRRLGEGDLRRRGERDGICYTKNHFFFGCMSRYYVKKCDTGWLLPGNR